MTPQKNIKTFWAKSFPTNAPDQSTRYKCSYEGCQPWGFEDHEKLEPCNKVFSRQCDLRRHQLNHTRPFKCNLCIKGFPSPKDLQRHYNSTHYPSITYLCTHTGCYYYSLRERFAKHRYRNLGFKRKDYWRSHMKDEHNASRQWIQEIQKLGIPMAVWKEEEPSKGMWVVVEPGVSKHESSESMGHSDMSHPVGTSVSTQPAIENSQTIDPVIQVLAEKAATDPYLKELMRKIANGEETPEELMELQRHIDELKTLNAVSSGGSSQATPSS